MWEEGWMHIKLSFVVGLYIYQFACHRIYKKLQNDEVTYTSNGMRLFNEVPTLVLFSVIFLVILRHELNWIFGVLGLLGLSILLMILFKLYKRYREKK